MQKPQGYDDVKVGGDFTPVELGGHHMIIKGVREEKSKTGKDMIVVAFDFAKNDKQAGYFTDLYENDTRAEKKWSAQGTQWILTMDNDGQKVSKNFKSFITSVERSNGFQVKWDKTFCSQFKDKKVGGVFGIVEESYNGEVKKRHKLRWFCEDNKADSAAIPNPKLLNGNGNSSGGNGSGTDGDGFMTIPDDSIEEIAF